AFIVPFERTTCPSEATVPSKSAKPAIPDDGSTKPEAARSSRLTSSFASSGVCAASFGLIGPALRSSFKLPAPGRSAATVNGNWELKEKLRSVTFTLSETWDLDFAFGSPIGKRVVLDVVFATGRFVDG